MRVSGMLPLGLGIVLAGGAVAYMQNDVAKPDAGTVSVVVAAEDIGFGQPIDEAALRTQPWPSTSLPDGVVTSTETLVSPDVGNERRAKRSIAAGELMLLSSVSNFGETVTITQLIEPGMRAVAIRVDDVSGVAGFVTPGDRVDVILTRDLDQSIQAHTILQNLKVLGIDQDADKKVRDKPSVVRTITVEVEPNDVQKVALAQQAGKLSLSLRNMETADTTRLDTITVQDLTDEDRPAPVKPVTAELPSVSVNRGGERSSVTVPSG